MTFQELTPRLVSDPAILSQEEILAVALHDGQDAMLEDAALFRPAAGQWTPLCYEAVIGPGDIEGLEDSASVSRDPEGRDVLLELSLTEDGQGVTANAEFPFLVFWNHGGTAITVDGISIAPGDYMTSRALPTTEAVRRLCSAERKGSTCL